MQKVIGHAHQIKLGRSSHLFFQNDFSPAHCILSECPEEMETLIENTVVVQLRNEFNLQCYLDPNNYLDFDTLFSKLPVNILITSIDSPISSAYDFQDFKLFQDDEKL